MIHLLLGFRITPQKHSSIFHLTTCLDVAGVAKQKTTSLYIFEHIKEMCEHGVERSDTGLTFYIS